MERIDPLEDHVLLSRFGAGDRLQFQGRAYTVLKRTTLATGEPALILQGEGKQFVIGAATLLAELKLS